MSRSSGPERASMPVAALVAVAAVGLGLSLYAGALDASLVRPGHGPDTAGTAADRAVAELAPDGVVLPDRLDRARAALPDDLRANLTLRADDRAWHAGPVPPAGAAGDDGRASVAVSVRVAPGRVRTGRLTVVVWR